MRKLRIVIGLAFWIVAIALSVHYGRGWTQQNPSTISELSQFVGGKRKPLTLDFDQPADLHVGDPIFQRTDNGYQVVGRITSIEVAAETGDLAKSAVAILYRKAPPVTTQTQLKYFQTTDDLGWMLETLLPERKRKAIAARVKQVWLENQDEMLDALQPIVEAGFRDGFNVIRKDLPQSIKNHKDQLSRLGAKYQRQVIEKQLVPLVKNEIWPIVRKHAEPTVNRVGKEIWQRASVWRFGWRLVYDKTPLVPKKNLLQKEWKRFIAKDAVPVLKSHTSEFVWVQKRIIADVAQNERVRQAVKKSFQRISVDPEVTQLLWKIVRETAIENKRLHQVMRDHWRRPETQAAIRQAVERFEPIAMEIGEMVIGSEQAGVTPEFAAVLRNQVLGKDRRWIVLETSSAKDQGPPIDRTIASRGGKTTVANNPFILSLGTRQR